MTDAAPIGNPELFFGLVAPIGVDLDIIQDSLRKHLKSVDYEVIDIHITDLMRGIPCEEKIDDSSYFEKYTSLIRYADSIRKKAQTNDVLSALAIQKIRQLREQKNRATPGFQGDPASTPIPGTAFVLRQFKREEEVKLLRKIYGRKFIQISAYLDNDERKQTLKRKIKGYSSATVADSKAEIQAIELINIDNHEETHDYGQRVSDVFHLGDVFVSGINSAEVDKTINRFINAFFGDNNISPTKMEYGMYAAAGAALRSIDLSRQVGAAIFSRQGEIITLGCNEVPKAFGGTYWCDDVSSPHRDFEEGKDANQQRKTEILHDFVDRLVNEGYIKNFSDEKTSNLVRELLQNDNINKSQLMDIIEFGRMIHAEMCAITDASRLGKALKDSILFCTTFPCHMCAKHIVSSGIKRVVFLEPYPKSYAEKLHSDSISFSDKSRKTHVIFEPFIGISPRRYRDIFEKKKRKDKQGKSKAWYQGKAVPQIEDASSGYITFEQSTAVLLKKLFKETMIE